MSEGSAPADAAGSDDALHQLHRQLEETRADLETIRKKVEDKAPWYKTMSGAISVAAFVLSTASAVYSYQHDIDQERQQARLSLNALSQRLLTLPKENFELTQKYKDDGTALATLAPLLNAENITLANSMKSLVKRFPDLATDGDKFVLASALVFSGLLPEALIIYEDLSRTAMDMNAAAGAYRTLGAYQLANGAPEAGRQSFQNAIAVFDSRFRSEDPFVKVNYNLQTYLVWAKSELWVRNCDEAAQVLGQATALIAEMRVPPDGRLLVLANEIKQGVQGCRAGQPLVGPPPTKQLP